MAGLAAGGFLFRRKAASDPVRVAYGKARQQFGELRLPFGLPPHPAAIVIHGGFWRNTYGLDLMTPLCGALASAGVATWNIEYRRVGDAGGGWPGTFLDVAAAADHLGSLAKEHRLDLSRIVSAGHSAGGHLALWLAGRRRIPAGDPLAQERPLPLAGAVSLAGIPDLSRAAHERLGGGAVVALMGGSPAAVPGRYAAASPAALLPLHVRQILVHGRDDDVVPPLLSQDYFSAAKTKGDDVRLVMPEGGHFGVIDPAAPAGRAAREAVVELLRGS
jgi:acetyl esterase/lipase